MPRSVVVATLLAATLTAQQAEVVRYRDIGGFELFLHVDRAAGAAGPAPAVVFFFGGGWNGGSVEQFAPQARYLASRGVTCFRADYRVKSRHGTTPRDAAADGQAAVAWVIDHAADFGVDPGRVCASGGSAGGHVAACAGIVPWLDPSIPERRPAALALFNPVLDTGPGGYGHDRIGLAWHDISPLHHVRAHTPPTWIAHGTGDATVRYESVERFAARMADRDRRCELLAWPGRGHGFFNPGRGDGADFYATTRELDRFLVSLGWIDGVPTLAPEGRSTWHGYERVDGVLEVPGSGERPWIVVAPDRPAAGRPWIWRARFFGHEPAADIELLRRGFHVAYVDVADLYGNEVALALWDRGYDLLRERFGLGPRPVLEAMSRGGLIAFRWAARRPERVAAIYADAPVCSIASWPGGKGAGRGDARSWQTCLAAHGLDEASLATWAGDPIDVLEPLAEARVPVLIVAGDADEVVPYAENGAIVASRYRELGGHVEELLKPGGGHHPHALPDPAPIVDFVRRHAGPGHTVDFALDRDGLGNSLAKFFRGGAFRVGFLGGSITHNPGWRSLVEQSLQRRFPSAAFTFVNAGIPSFGSTPGAFRWRDDLLRDGPIDLLIVEAAVNDSTNGRTPTEMLRGMEGIVRGVRRELPDADVVLLHFVDPDKIAQIERGEVPAVVAAHEAVAERYGCPSLNLAAEVTFRIQAGEFTWKDDFQDLHPSPFGQRLYAAAIDRLFDRQFAGDPGAITPHPLPSPIDAACYQWGRQLAADAATDLDRFALDPEWRPDDGKPTRPGFVAVPMLVADEPGASLTLRFRGTAVGIQVVAGPDAGVVEWSLDGGDWRRVDLFTRWSGGLHLPWAHVLEARLRGGEHELQLRGVARESGYGGDAVRIVRFLVNSPLR